MPNALEPPSLLDLPPELISLIISNVSKDGDAKPSLACLARTCRSLYNLVIPTLYRSINLDLPQLLSFLQEGGNVESQETENLDDSITTNFIESTSGEVARRRLFRFGSIEHLDLELKGEDEPMDVDEFIKDTMHLGLSTNLSTIHVGRRRGRGPHEPKPRVTIIEYPSESFYPAPRPFYNLSSMYIQSTDRKDSHVYIHSHITRNAIAAAYSLAPTHLRWQHVHLSRSEGVETREQGNGDGNEMRGAIRNLAKLGCKAFEVPNGMAGDLIPSGIKYIRVHYRELYDYDLHLDSRASDGEEPGQMTMALLDARQATVGMGEKPFIQNFSIDVAYNLPDGVSAVETPWHEVDRHIVMDHDRKISGVLVDLAILQKRGLVKARIGARSQGDRWIRGEDEEGDLQSDLWSLVDRLRPGVEREADLKEVPFEQWEGIAKTFDIFLAVAESKPHIIEV